MAVKVYTVTNTISMVAEDELSYIVMVDKFIWDGASSGDTLKITDLNGNLILQWKAPSNNYSKEFDVNRKYRGIIAETMTHGTLLIWGILGEAIS